jgi:translation initiation factor IF-2
MAKMRVHEIAKELGLQSQELTDRLKKLGLDVKSHSSMADIDDVRRLLKREEDEKRARTDESRVSGSVIRRRPRADGSPGGPVSSAAAAPAGPAVVVRRPAAVPVVESTREEPRATATIVRRPEERPAEPPPALATPSEATSAEGFEPTTAAAEAPVEVTATTAEASTEVTPSTEAPVVEVAATATDAAPEATAEAAPAGEEDDKRDRRDRGARPDGRKRDDEDEDDDDDKAYLELESLGLSEDDFISDMGGDRVIEFKTSRVAPPPPSTKPVTMQKEDEPQARVVRSIDPEVLRARLSGQKRPEPPKDWGRPSDIPASPVTELVVRTDASGKRKELVDVRKEAARAAAGAKPGAKPGAKKREELSAKDMLESRRGQVFYPTLGRKKPGAKGPGRGLIGKPLRRPDIAPGSRRAIELGESITVADLAKQMGRKATEVIAWLMREGVMASINQPLTPDIAGAVAEEFGFEVTSKVFDEEALLVDAERVAPAADPNAVLRAPVVTVMGHVDHGKTTLLDRIRKTNVAAGEAGGITQAIAGYQVKTGKGMVTFLDTPGHAAFTAMRARGAKITDIVILVVAADDGVMPQTVEALQHAKAAKVPIIVAVNKIDKPDANPDRVLQQLTQYGIVVEEWGGETLSRRISAKTGDGIDDLLELLALQAEILELKANPALPARGTVIEAEVHKGRGPVATVLVQEGTLKVGDAVVVGEAIGRVRALITDGGKRVNEAGPAMPVQILGLDNVPNPADELRVAKSVDDAREIAEHRRETRRMSEQSNQQRVSLQDIFARINQGEDAQKELKIIVKADVQGSVEALAGALTALTTPKVRVSVIQGSVGAVVESDVEFARASEAIVVGFNVRPDTKALKAARSMGVDIRTHSIIYECVDEVRLAMEGLLAPVSKEQYLGRAEVRQTFMVPKVGTIAGCMVVDGTLTRAANIRLLRDGKTLFEGKLASLKRFKDDVREVSSGYECGMSLDGFNDIKMGDVIEAFTKEAVTAP